MMELEFSPREGGTDIFKPRSRELDCASESVAAVGSIVVLGGVHFTGHSVLHTYDW
jgi:hypothetical protein